MALSEACCTAGKDWTGTPAGATQTVGGLECYVAGEGNGARAVLMLHDIHGWQTKNARLYADKLAACGFVAVLPDFYHGQKLPDFSQIRQFIGQFPQDKVMKEIEEVMAALKAKGVKHFGAVGFCWGGFYAVALAGESKLDAAVICHGSLLKPENIKTISKPTLFLCSDNDSQIPKEFREEIEEILKPKPFDTGVVFYPGMEHGWTLRGDQADEKVAKDAQDAFQRTVSFFEKHVQ